MQFGFPSILHWINNIIGVLARGDGYALCRLNAAVNQEVENCGMQRTDELHAGSIDSGANVQWLQWPLSRGLEPNRFIDLRRFEQLELASF